MAKRATRTIDDLGEKIGGARKDKAVKTGPRAPRAKVDTDPRPAWARRYMPMEQIDRVTKTGTGKWSLVYVGVRDRFGGKVLMRDLPSEQAAEKAIPMAAVGRNHRIRDVGTRESPRYEIWREVTDRKRVKVVPDAFKSREEAMVHMAMNAEKIIETKTGFGEEVFVKPEKVYRTGPQTRAGDIAGEAFMKTLGMRGVEFGNWQSERQAVMNHAYDAMQDLAHVTGIDPKSVSLKGDLAVAFGARGSGLSSARAHYEPKYAAINLTKMDGAGALAHEWWHGLDHLLGRTDDPRLNELDPKSGTKAFKQHLSDSVFASQRVGNPYAGKGQIPPAVREAYKNLIDTIYRRPEQYTEDKARVEKFANNTKAELESRINGLRKHLTEQLTYGKRNVAPAKPEQIAKFDALASKIVSGEALKTDWKSVPTKPSAWNPKGSFTARWTNDVLEDMSKIVKEVRGTSGFNKEGRGSLDQIASMMKAHSQRLNVLADAAASSVKTRMIPTEFAREAHKLDEGRVADYWGVKHEMTARSFSAYIEDKLKAANRRSDYLSFGSDNKYYPTLPAKPFPEGAERAAINQKFDELFAAMREARVVEPATAQANTNWNKVASQSIEAGMQEASGPKGWSDAARAKSAEVRRNSNLPQSGTHDIDVHGVTTEYRADATGDPFKFKSRTYQNVGYGDDGFPKAELVHANTLEEYEGKIAAAQKAMKDGEAAAAKVREASKAKAEKPQPRGMDGLTRAERAGRTRPLAAAAPSANATTTLDKFRSSYEATLAEQVKANPGKYGYGLDRVPEMARKMTEALARGEGDTKSKTVQAVAKSLGVKPTVGGIKAALNDQPAPTPKPKADGLSTRELNAVQRAIKSGAPVKKDTLTKATNAQLQKLDDVSRAARQAQTGTGNADWGKINQIEAWRNSIREQARAQTTDVVAPPDKMQRMVDTPRKAAIGDNGGPSDAALKAAKKLEAVAARTIEKAEKEANAPRLMNTARRARMGSGVIDRAHQDIADAKTALKIAEALRNGEAGALSNVKSLADIRELRDLARQAERATDRKLNRNYKPGGHGLQTNDIGNLGDVKGYVRIEPSDVDRLARAATGSKVKGVASDLKVLRKHAARTTVNGRTNYETSDPAVFKALRNVANAVVKNEKTDWAKYPHEIKHEKYIARRYLAEVRDFERQRGVAGTSAEARQAALRAFLDVRAGKTTPSLAAIAERELIGMKLPGFFPTPQSLAERMAKMAEVKAGMTVLEPSAGTGRIADALKAAGANVETVEMQSRLRDILQKKGHTVVDHDFTTMDTAKKYDRIVMNPPFEKGQDMAHVKRAYEMLKPGGKIVAIMGEGAFFRGDKKATEFRSWLEGRGVSEKLPEGTFKESNTGVNTRLVTITKPTETAAISEAAKPIKGTPRLVGIPADGSKPFTMAILDSPGDVAANAKRIWNDTANLYTQKLSGYEIHDGTGAKIGWSDAARSASAEVRKADAGHNQPPAVPQIGRKPVHERAKLDFKHLAPLSMEQLTDLQRSIMDDPKSRNPEHLAGKSIYIYNKQAKAKLDRLAQEISYRIGQNAKAKAAAEAVNASKPSSAFERAMATSQANKAQGSTLVSPVDKAYDAHIAAIRDTASDPKTKATNIADTREALQQAQHDAGKRKRKPIMQRMIDEPRRKFDSFEAMVADTKRTYDHAEKVITAELAKPNPRLVAEKNGLTTVMTKSLDGDGYRITTLRDGQPLGHREYGRTATDLRHATQDMVMGGLRPSAIASKIGTVAMITAPLAAAAVAFDATKNSALANGIDEGTAKLHAGMAATAAGASTAAIGLGVAKVIGAGIKVASKVAPAAAGPIGLAVVAGMTAYGAMQAYKHHGLKGAALSVVGADALLDIKDNRAALASSRAAQFSTANQAYEGMKKAPGPDTFERTYKSGPKAGKTEVVQNTRKAAA